MFKIFDKNRISNNYYTYNIWIIYSVFFVAIILQSVLYFSKNFYLQPSWVVISLIYWIVIFPKKINVGTGFNLGLILDCILGSTLGIHSLSFSILSYLTIRKIYIFRYAFLWKQFFFIVFFSAINQSTKFLVTFVINNTVYSPNIFWNCILDGIIWPFLVIFMHNIYRC